MRKKTFRKKLAAGVMALALCISGMGASLAATPPDNSETYNVNPTPAVYDKSGPLFVATNFHVFAEDEASITSHCNGNIATKFLSQKSNSGSNQLYASQLPEYNYIRKFQDGSVVRFGPQTQVVFGSETDVYLRQGAEIYVDMFDEDGNESSVQKMDITANRVFTEKGADDSQRFINFNEEFRKLSILSYNLAKETPTVTVSDNEINLNGLSGTQFVNVTPDQLSSGGAFIINNTDFMSNQAVVINVDLGTRTSYTVPFTQVLIKDTTGTSFGTGEDKGNYTGHGNVLWNFYGRDVNGDIITYTGDIMTCSEFKGTILAPDAVISTAASNQDGNFIGREVHLGGGETHRWDFGGTLPSYNYSLAKGSLNAVVIENDGTTPVANVEIYVYEKGDISGEPVAKITTDETGTTTTVGNLPIGGEYTGFVKQIPVGYEIVENHTPADTLPNDEDKETINSTGLHTLNFVLKKTTTETPTQGYIKVVVKDKDTGSYVKDVTVELVGDSTITRTTDDFGVAKTDKINIGKEFVVSIDNLPPGYVVPSSQNVTVSSKNPDELLFEISKAADITPEGSIQIKVYEAGTNQTKPVEGAVVSITEGSHIIKEVTVTTDENGVTEVVKQLPLDKTYTTTVISIPAGYSLVESAKVQNPTLTTSEPNKVVIYELVKEKGSMQVIITDTSDQPIKGAKVDIIDDATGNVIATTTTDANGKTAEIYNLEIGGSYTAKVVELPDGYEIVKTGGETEEEAKTETGTIASKTEVLELEFQIRKIPTGNLDVTVKEKDSDTKVSNAVVKVYNADDECIRTVTTDSTGHFVVNDLSTGTYTVKITEPTGYKELEGTADTKTVIVLPNATASAVFELEKIPTGNLDVTVKEKGSTTTVANAVVKVYNSSDECVKTVTTDSSGHFVVENLPTGTYTVKTTQPTGYLPPDATNASKEAIVVVDPTVEVVVELEKIPTGNLDVTVEDKDDSTTKIEGATVKVYKVNDDSTETPVQTVTTDSTGHFVINDIPTGKYVIKTTEPATGYLAPDATNASIAATVVVNATEYVVVKLAKETGLLDVIVKYPDDTGVEGVSVTVTGDGISDTTLITDADGKTTEVTGLTIGEEYSVEVKSGIPQYYTLVTSDENPNPREVNIPNKNKVTVVFEVKNTGILDITVKEENSSTVIPGAKVQVVEKDNPSNVIADGLTTDSNGKVVVKDLDTGEYTVIVKEVPPEYCIPANQDATVTAGSTTEKEFVVNKPGNLEVTIIDEKTLAVIPNATVEIKNNATGSVITRVTNSAGEIAVNNLQPGGYTITTTSVPQDYNIPNPETATVVSGGTTETELKVKKVPGDLVVTITDVTTGLPIAGATIVVKDSADTEVARVTTDSEGKFTVKDLYPSDYKIITESIPSSYDPSAKPGDTTATVVSGQTTQKDLLVPSTTVDDTVGKLIVTIKDEVTGDPIPNADIEITYPDSTSITVTTDPSGVIEKENLQPGTYTIETTKVPTGYNPPAQQTATVVGGQTSRKDLVVAKKTTGTLVVVVADVNGNPIAGVGITVTDSTNAQVCAPLTTGADGKTTEVTGLALGETYKATLDKSTLTNYYVLNETVNVKAETVANATTLYQIPFEVKKTGALEVVIKDKNTQALIAGAQVTVTNKDTNEVVADKVITDADGKITVSGLPGGNYTVTTNSVPNGYTAPDPEDVTVTVGATANKELFVQKGSLQVQINDKNTGAPIPEATVVIKSPDGTVVATVQTDANGMTPVVKELTIGTTYTIETTKVPEGYTAPTPTTQEIKSSTTEVVKLQVGRDSGTNSTLGSLSVIITDKNTGKPIPGATVEVSNSKGEVVKTVVTDDTGAFTVTDLKPDSYTVKTTKVPEGYTAPDPQKAEVKADARTDVHLYVVKGASTSQTTNTDKVVQTGDESNVQAVSILAVLACLGIVVVSIMRKREENLI